MPDKNISRKTFAVTVAKAATGAFGLGIIAACTGKSTPSKPAASSPCSDVKGLDPAALNLRKQFNYVTATSDPAKVCSNCALYKKPTEEGGCGGCTLFEGPVEAKGYCTAWSAGLDAG